MATATAAVLDPDSTTARSALMLMAGEHARRRRVVIVGGGFAGFHAARALSRLANGLDVEVILVNPTDYFLYLPLLPEVAAGILDPRRVSVPLTATLPGVRLLLGTVDGVDLDGRRVALVDPEGQRRTVAYDRLLLATGSVHRLLPIPGVATHAHGVRSLAEALWLRDHLVRQLELAASWTTRSSGRRAAPSWW
jgi:NADH:ubiquinone reductase (H+-translocating)